MDSLTCQLCRSLRQVQNFISKEVACFYEFDLRMKELESSIAKLSGAARN